MAIEGNSNFSSRWNLLESDDEDYDEENFNQFLNKTKENLTRLTLNRDSPISARGNENNSESSKSFNNSSEILTRVSDYSESPFTTDGDDADLQFMKFLRNVKKDLPLKSDPSLPSSGEPVWNCISPCSKQRSQNLLVLENIQNIQPTPKKQRGTLSHISHILQEIENDSDESFLLKRSSCAKRLYDLFNENIFDNKLPHDLELQWCSKLTTTAGKTFALKTNNKYHSCKISLSSKILINFERLRDTLLHEMCHAAVMLISQISKVGHGPLWQSWAARCKGVLPDIEVPQRCHNYEISYSFIYRCTHCSWKIGRQRRCFKLSDIVCPKCRSPLSLTKS